MDNVFGRITSFFLLHFTERCMGAYSHSKGILFTYIQPLSSSRSLDNRWLLVQSNDYYLDFVIYLLKLNETRLLFCLC